MQNDQRADETMPTAAEKPRPNGNIGVGSAGEDMGGQTPLPTTPNIGQGEPDTAAEPGLVGREESGIQGEPKSGFPGDGPHLPGQTEEPGNPDTGTHYLPAGEDAE